MSDATSVLLFLRTKHIIALNINYRPNALFSKAIKATMTDPITPKIARLIDRMVLDERRAVYAAMTPDGRHAWQLVFFNRVNQEILKGNIANVYFHRVEEQARIAAYMEPVLVDDGGHHICRRITRLVRISYGKLEAFFVKHFDNYWNLEWRTNQIADHIHHAFPEMAAL
jgi:hypothetical protein